MSSIGVRLSMDARPNKRKNGGDLLCYRKLVRTGVARPFVVSGLSRNDKEVCAIGTGQHQFAPDGPVIRKTLY